MAARVITEDTWIRVDETVLIEEAVGYQLAGGAPPSPSFHNAGAISVVSANFGVVGFSNSYSGTFNASQFVNEETGSFLVVATAADATAWGFDAASASADFRNAGWFEVRSAGDATGVETWDSTFDFANSGVISVSAAEYATGAFLANGGTCDNAGLIYVRGQSGAVGVMLRGHAYGFSNSGTIVAESGPEGDPSVAVFLDPFQEHEYVLTNSGLIAGDIAILSGSEISPDPQAVELVDNSGEIYGAIFLDSGDDVLVNRGEITGLIDLGTGDDVYDGTLGSHDGMIFAGQGADRLTGGAQGEIFYGEDGDDAINAGGGDDFVDGGRGSDILDGGAGFDILSYMEATTAVVLDLAAGTADGPGHDTIRNFERVIGTAYDDRLTGSAKADVLEGGYGDDVISGGGGGDTLLGDVGNDVITGGAGDDRFVFSLGDGQDTVTDFQAGGAEDRLDVYGYAAYLELRQVGADTLVVLSASDSILLNNVQASALTAADFWFNVEPLASAAPPPAPVGQQRVENDFVVDAGEVMHVVVPSGSGFVLTEPKLFFSHAALFNLGTIRVERGGGPTAGSAPVIGFSFSNGAFAWSVIDNRSGSVIEVTSRSDAGAIGVYSPSWSGDVYNAGAFTAASLAGYARGVATWSPEFFDFVNTGQFHVAGATFATGVEMHNGGNFWNVGEMVVAGGAGTVAAPETSYNDSSAVGVLLRGDYTFDNSGTLRVTDTSAGLNSIGLSYSNASGTKVFFNSGLIEADYAIRQDEWTSNEAAATELVYNSGELRGRVDLGVGGDELHNTGLITGRVDLGAGDDLYDGVGGTQLGGVYGGAGDDVLTGGSGADVFDGGMGADILVGGAGADTLTGGSGADVFRFATGSGADVITDFSVAEDRIQTDLSYTLSQQGADTLVSFAGGGSVVLRNVTASSLGGANFTAVPASTAPTPHPEVGITGTSGADSLAGTSLADTMRGLDGADFLQGGGGYDFLEGGAGNDILVGGAGNDTLFGGSGADIFVYAADYSDDTILDFNPASGDRLQLVGAQSFTAYQDGADVKVVPYFPGIPATIILKNVNLAQVQAGISIVASGPSAPPATVPGPPAGLPRPDEPTVPAADAPQAAPIVGGAGADTLTGGAGRDLISGGAGNDTLVGGAGVDRLWGGAGADVFVFRPGDSVAAYQYGALADIIYDFSAAEGDVIQLEGVAFGGVNQYGDDVLVQFYAAPSDQGGEILIRNATVEEVRAALYYTPAPARPTGPLAIGGGGGGDLLTGSEARDLMQGFAGDDTLRGLGGDDELQGGAGDDVLMGGAGDDRLDGGVGFDAASYADAASGVTVSLGVTGPQATGGAGRDTLVGIEDLVGSAFADVLTGDAGNNILAGGAGDDVLDGSGGDDLFDGGTGVDTVTYASAGAGVAADLTRAEGGDAFVSVENLTGSAFADTLRGDAGANVLSGGAGDDVLEGGDGADRLDGGAGIDTASYAGATGGVRVNLGVIGAQATIGAGSDTLISIENVTGSAFADTLRGNSGANVLIGGAGDDVIEGGSGADRLEGGAGVDTATYVNTAGGLGVTVDLRLTGQQNTGGAGMDVLLGFENLTGSRYDDRLTGDAGANVLVGAGGADVLWGGAGNDVLDGGAGTDTAVYSDAVSGVTVNLNALGSAQNTGGAGTDTLLSIENVIGSAFNDNLRGNATSNVLDGGDGNDVLDGGGGHDKLYGGAGIDTATYANSAAAVTVRLTTTNAQVTGGAGSDTLVGIENLTGSRYDDRLTGDDGANVLTGGSGDDLLDGGAGDDTLDGSLNFDTATYAGASGGVTVNLTLSGAQNTGGAGVDTLISIENVTGSAFNDSLRGNTGANTLIGGAGDDILEGGGGEDRLDGGGGIDTASYAHSAAAVTINLNAGGTQPTGGAGTDTLVSIENVTGSAFADTLRGNAVANVLDGGAGADVLLGGGGNDVLVGGAGNDVMTGGTGDDLFVFGPGFGQDRIDDFAAGGTEDRLDFSAYTGTGVTWTLTQVGDDAVFSFSDGATLTLAHVQATSLSQTGAWGWG
ncbi:calcium-binding protein [Caulobacter sp. 17J80-11]|uniref:calcium-binding protein n=1 Tax=Caulobacter sp. 17J80-11 TaxID=2763502 RepID=UPI00165379C7|nr:calcium-binding protein [Caulobacter sp. 17J80-11]MBC6981701.1 hypothetical protein [Caulobacter sp. 17J80-11]